MRKMFVIIAVSATAFSSLAYGDGDSTKIMLRGWAPTDMGTIDNQLTVAYEPVKAGDAAGATALLARLSAGAAQVCTIGKAGKSAHLAGKIDECKAAVLAKAVKEINSTELTTAAAH